MSLDLWLFELINGLAGQTPVLDQVMRAMVSDYVGPTVQVLGLLGFWFEGKSPTERRGNQRAVLRAVVALAISGILLGLCNLIYFRDRPFRYHDVNMLFYYPTDSSFPSNSATVVFAISATIWLRDRRWGWPMLILAGGFAFSRVYVGVHYPADVLAGFMLGAGTGWFLSRYGHRLNLLFDPIIKFVRWLNLA
jgi:undecaprenyl-diphosphatase